jgi:hypothetical protein
MNLPPQMAYVVRQTSLRRCIKPDIANNTQKIERKHLFIMTGYARLVRKLFFGLPVSGGAFPIFPLQVMTVARRFKYTGMSVVILASRLTSSPSRLADFPSRLGLSRYVPSSDNSSVPSVILIALCFVP